jgi:hypothetical protein
MGLRIRWLAAAKGAAVAIGGLLALAALHAVLKPVPPPLPADVGLPRAADPSWPPTVVRRPPAAASPGRKGARKPREPQPQASGWRALRRIANERGSTRGPRAPGRSGRRPEGRPQISPSRQEPSVPRPPPVPTPDPAPSPDAPPLPPPPATASPEPPNDGSIEFAPR